MMSRNDPRYEPTQQEIAEACQQIRSGWSKCQRVQRSRREPVVPPWTAPVLLSIVDHRGEYVCTMGDFEACSHPR